MPHIGCWPYIRALTAATTHLADDLPNLSFYLWPSHGTGKGARPRRLAAQSILSIDPQTLDIILDQKFTAASRLPDVSPCPPLIISVGAIVRQAMLGVEEENSFTRYICRRLRRHLSHTTNGSTNKKPASINGPPSRSPNRIEPDR